MVDGCESCPPLNSGTNDVSEAPSPRTSAQPGRPAARERATPTRGGRPAAGGNRRRAAGHVPESLSKKPKTKNWTNVSGRVMNREWRNVNLIFILDVGIQKGWCGCGETADGHERPALSVGRSVCRSGPILCDHHQVPMFGGGVAGEA